MGSGTILREVMAAAELLKNDFGVDADVWSATSFNELRRDGMSAERWNLLHPTEPRAQELRRAMPRRPRGPGRSPPPTTCATTPTRSASTCRGRYVVLGTDGFGRSDYRVKLRRFFEVNRYYVDGRGAEGARRRRRDQAGQSSPRRSRSTASTPSAPRSVDGLSEAFAATMSAWQRNRSQGAGHRRLQGRAGDRGAGQGRRHASRRRIRSSRSSPTRRRWTCRRRAPARSRRSSVKVGDKVSEGTRDRCCSTAARRRGAAPAAAPQDRRCRAPPAPTSAPAGVAEVRVPDIGDFKDVPVIEIFVKLGRHGEGRGPARHARVRQGDDGRAGAARRASCRRSTVKVGDKVCEGAVILTLATGSATAAPSAAAAVAAAVDAGAAAAPAGTASAAAGSRGRSVDEAALRARLRRPGVRKLARELGVDLGKVKGSGDKGRILQEDVEAFAKGGAPSPAPAAGKAAPAAGGGGGIDLLPWPKVDFAKFGPIEAQAAVAHQEDLRREPAPQLGDDPARHQARRGRHHRARGVPRADEQGEREDAASRSACSPS